MDRHRDQSGAMASKKTCLWHISTFYNHKRTVNRQECEKYNYTSAQTEEEDTVSQKRMKKIRTFEDYVQDLSPEEDESLPDKKKEDTVLLPVPPPKIKLSHRGQNARLLELPAPPELANTAIRQPASPASSDISGCSRPTPHRSPTRSESTEAFSPESARSMDLAHLSVEFESHHSPGAERVGHPHPVSQLSKVGGRNHKDCVHKVMERLFTNNLMAGFNMKGQGRSEKKAFQDTVFYSLVKGNCIFHVYTGASQIRILKKVNSF
ncbi:uncharacterized protein LOC114839615 [Esox lucius]|uniref:uncharacterized protein LOC114839615 n=1 Tax=Esox lucius TaxID=8010 RepID=UPI00147723DC|nr:uncharacterized protein LOC114839615 [Esox lucius]